MDYLNRSSHNLFYGFLWCCYAATRDREGRTLGERYIRHCGVRADVDELRVSEITIDEGPTMKRWRPRARGRANKIFKRMSHVTVAVAETGQ